MHFERFPGAQYANIFSYLPSNDREGYAELDEFMNFYKKFYIPNNATLSIAR